MLVRVCLYATVKPVLVSAFPLSGVSKLVSNLPKLISGPYFLYVSAYADSDILQLWLSSLSMLGLSRFLISDGWLGSGSRSLVFSDSFTVSPPYLQLCSFGADLDASKVYFFIFETQGRTVKDVNELFDKNNVLHRTLSSGGNSDLAEKGTAGVLDKSKAHATSNTIDG